MSKPKPIPSSIYKKRREALLASTTVDCIVISANANMQKSYDTAYPFEQEKHFLYLTGINEPGWVLVLQKNGKEFLLQPQRDERHAQFEGVINDEFARVQSGIQTTVTSKEGWNTIKELQLKTVGILEPFSTYIGVYEMFTHPMRKRIKQKIKRILPRSKFINIAPPIANLRVVKDEYELNHIQYAIDITGAVLNPIMDTITMFKTEQDIEAEIAYGFRKHSSREGYPSIVSAGINTTQLHYDKYSKKIESDDIILIDVGAQYGDYMADISRTFPYKTFSKRQKEVYDAVRDTQEYAFSRIKPGIHSSEYEAEVETYIGKHMKRLGLIDTITRREIRHFFPSYTSHFLGLDVHDAGGHDVIFEPGMVLTVEPGIYIPKEAIGVRIEDDIIITKTGIENMSKKIAKV